jgi:hypothetical protein
LAKLSAGLDFPLRSSFVVPLLNGSIVKAPCDGFYNNGAIKQSNNANVEFAAFLRLPATLFFPALALRQWILPAPPRGVNRPAYIQG